MELANAIQNPWWYLSALVVSSSGGFQLNQSKRHEDKLELVIETGYKLDLPELSKFAAKVRRPAVKLNNVKGRTLGTAASRPGSQNSGTGIGRPTST